VRKEKAMKDKKMMVCEFPRAKVPIVVPPKTLPVDKVKVLDAAKVAPKKKKTWVKFSDDM